MRVCKYEWLWRQDHASTNLKKVLSWKTRQVYFIYPFPRQLKLGKSLEKHPVSIFFPWAVILSVKNPYFGRHLFGKQRLITRTSFVYKTSRMVRISLLISALNSAFFSGESYFIKAIENVLSCVCIAWYKHSRGWKNSRQLCKPSTSSRVCITVSNSPTPLVFIYQVMQTRKYLQLKCTVSMPEKNSICLNRGREESVGNDDVSIVCARKYEMVRMT